jgi:hypothetical protein
MDIYRFSKRLLLLLAMVVFSGGSLDSAYSTNGLHGLFFLNNANLGEVGRFAVTPQFLFEDYVGANALRFLVNGNYGIADNAELGVSLPVVRISGGGSRSGLGDISAAGKLRFREETSDRPAIAAIFRLDLPTGDTDKGFGDALDILASCAAEYSLTDIELSCELGVAICGDIETEYVVPGKNPKKGIIRNKRKNYLFLGAGVNYPVNEKLDLLGELFLNGYNGRNGGAHVLNAGLRYAWRPSAHIKFGLLVGIEDGAPDLGMFSGFSWAL